MNSITSNNDKSRFFTASEFHVIASGEKTQHRHPIALDQFREAGSIGYQYAYVDSEGYWCNLNPDDDVLRCPLGQVGEQIWVRHLDTEWGKGPRASWATFLHIRVLLEITNTRIEYLGGITPMDAKAEAPDITGPVGNLAAHARNDPYIYHYASEWQEKHGLNFDWSETWVWVIEFKVLEVLK